MNQQVRPLQASVYAGLFALSGAVMLLLCLYSTVYLIPAIGLVLQSVLLWRGIGQKWFTRLLTLNQLTFLIMALDLWLGDALHLPTLTISAIMLFGNFVLGGPLMGVLAIAVLGSMHFSKALPDWFAAGHGAQRVH